MLLAGSDGLRCHLTIHKWFEILGLPWLPLVYSVVYQILSIPFAGVEAHPVSEIYKKPVSLIIGQESNTNYGK